VFSFFAALTMRYPLVARYKPLMMKLAGVFISTYVVAVTFSSKNILAIAVSRLIAINVAVRDTKILCITGRVLRTRGRASLAISPTSGFLTMMLVVKMMTCIRSVVMLSET